MKNQLTEAVNHATLAVVKLRAAYSASIDAKNEFATMAIVDQVAPPTINLVDQDPQCDLDYVPLKARPMKIDIALSNAFGFGGTNSTLVFKRM